MDLFYVERYNFNEDGQNNDELEKERLQILNDKIRKRQREKLEGNSEHVETKCKKKKRSKDITEDENVDQRNENTAENNKSGLLKTKKHKKATKVDEKSPKKDAKKDKVLEERIDIFNDEDHGVEIKKAKKKKKIDEQLQQKDGEKDTLRESSDSLNYNEHGIESKKVKKNKRSKAVEILAMDTTDDNNGTKDESNASIHFEQPDKIKTANKKKKSKIIKSSVTEKTDCVTETKDERQKFENPELETEKVKKHNKSLTMESLTLETTEDDENERDENEGDQNLDSDHPEIGKETLHKSDTVVTEEEYFPILGTSDKKKEKIVVKRTLPKWISNPKMITADITKGKIALGNVNFLENFIKEKLKRQEIHHLFPVQAVVIPYILSQLGQGTVYGKGGLTPPDICVSAPTGSGKTLAYVLPIVQVLSHCFVRRLQAIVILPSKDLAAQIKTVISSYVGGTQIRVGLAAGMKSFQQEQEQLVSVSPTGIASTVDILVCTPGRLVDHIDNTNGFTLEHLRFLVIDEADRLLGQSYHNWLEKIFQAAYRTHNDASSDCNVATFRSRAPTSSALSIGRVELPLQKLLFSATMTQNPEKLAPLQLVRPVLFASSEKVLEDNPNKTADNKDEESSNERYILPESLTEKMDVCKQGEKPLIVIYLMKVLGYKRALCFTGSIETTHRLFLLVKACDIRAAEFSSSLNQSQRKGILRDFKSGQIDLLICSDAMSRGMDIDNVLHVISYDPPVNIKTYVHRVGRTARAGQPGMALTLLSPKEVYHFKQIIRNGKRTTLPKLNVSSTDVEPLIEQYEAALISLKDSVSSERARSFKQK